jgi:RNA polymerase sigma-70 factor (ECF subfamily)
MTAVYERSNEEWIKELSKPGPDQEAAIADLRATIIAGLPYALSPFRSPSDPQFDDLLEETAQETLIRVLEKLDTFEGRSKFTTWVYKIAVRIALTELRRKRWQDVSLESVLETVEGDLDLELAIDEGPGPDDLTEQDDLMARLAKVIDEELTEKQRTAMVAIALRGMPLEEVARRMGTNRNALYKLLHDARVRVKARLEQEGLSYEEISDAFE